HRMGMSAQLPDHLSKPIAGTLPRPLHTQRDTFADLLSGLLANEWITAAAIFAFTRFVALAGAYSGVSRLVQEEPARNKGWLAELALMWDSAWYVTIAREGYTWRPGAEGGTNVAFAPLYPFLLHALSTLLNWLTF